MNEQRYLPDADRVGMLTSTVLLAFAFTHLVQSPEFAKFSLELQLPGFLFQLPLTLSTAMGLLTAGLTATGMDWLLRSHPSLNGRPTYQWWLLPMLTTFVVGVPLSILPSGSSWWLGFLITGAFLFFVFVAEYVVVDPSAPYYAISMAGLTAISYTLFFVLAVALRYGNVRLYILAPALFLAAALTSLRILHLRLSGRWEYAWSLGIAFVCVQLASGLHYWPLSPIQFGLMLIGSLYGLTNLAINLDENQPARRALLEPLIVTGLCWGLAVFIQ
jgi:hypothetical protein